mgnify:CR=1 FL=1
MNESAKLHARRDAILVQISELRQMRRGTITLTRPMRTRKDGSVYQAGPYFKLQVWKEGRNQTLYLSPEQHERISPEVENYQTLLKLTDELVEINERLTLLEQTDAADAEKKTTSRGSRKRS